MSIERFPDEKIREEFVELHRSTCEGDDCPSLDTLWESAMAELDQERNEKVILHMGECPACAAAWRFAGEVSPAETPVPFPRARPSVFRSFRLQAAAAAAVVVIGAGLGWLYLGPDRESAPVYRTQETVVLQPVAEDDAALPRERFVLRWTPGPEGTTYQVRVTDEDLAFLARGRNLDRPEFLVPEAVLDGLPPGAAILWHVTANLPDGRLIESESFSTRLE